jgi:hypothetical protein
MPGYKFKKQINFTQVSFNTVTRDDIKSYTDVFARKLNDRQVKAILRKAYGKSLVEQSIVCHRYSHVYEMSIEYFTEVAKQIR